MKKKNRKGKLQILILTTLLMPFSAEAKNKDLWGFITEINASIPHLSVASVKGFQLPLHLINQNEYVNFYESDPLAFTDGSKITDIDVRMNKISNENTPFLSFSWQGSCISLDTVKKHYPELTLTDIPRGRSENEVTSHTTPADSKGRTVTFSFAVKQPDCLSQVVLSSQK